MTFSTKEKQNRIIKTVLIVADLARIRPTSRQVRSGLSNISDTNPKQRAIMIPNRQDERDDTRNHWRGSRCSRKRARARAIRIDGCRRLWERSFKQEGKKGWVCVRWTTGTYHHSRAQKSISLNNFLHRWPGLHAAVPKAKGK